MRRTLTAVVALVVFALVAAPAGAADRPTKGLRYPSLTPDGSQVVFAYRGDVWIAPTAPGSAAGQARRLTMHEAQDTLPRVSPDGKRVAFSSVRNGNFDLFVLDLAGGEPRQVTFHSAGDVLCDWSPDGKRLLFASSRDVDGTGNTDLYEMDVSGGTPRRITRDGAREGTYSTDGSKIVYVRGFNTIYQDDYRGSANYDLYVVDAAGGTPRRVTDTPGNERYPYFSKDGSTIWFVAEDKGVANLWAIPADAAPGGKSTARPVTTFEGDDVHRPCRACNEGKFVFERAGALWVTDLDAEKPEPRPLELRVQSDVRNSGLEVRTLTSGGEQVSLTRDGAQIAFTLRGDVWTMPAAGGEGRRWTTGTSQDEWPRFSPDGTKIAYQSDARGNSDVLVLDLRTKKTTPVTRHSSDDFFHSWTPDGKRLVFVSERSGNRDLWVADLDGGPEAQLTNDPSSDDDPSVSPDGRWIAFDSGRDGNQAIFVMPIGGGAARRVSDGSGHFQVPSWSPDGSMLVYEQYNPASGDSAGLFVCAAQGGTSVQIAADGQAACWSPKGDWIYFHATRDGEAGVWRVRAPDGVAAGERVPFLGRIEVDVRRELADLFDEAWTKLRDGFYDPKMHDVDWEKVKAKYRDMAIDTENKDEFYVVVSQMLAELKASHLGISPGGRRERAHAEGSSPVTGYLGAELEASRSAPPGAPQSAPSGGAAPADAAPADAAPAAAAASGRKVLSVLPKGPADAAGLRVGDVVLSIGGKVLGPSVDIDQVLAGTVEKELAVAFRPITERGLGDERTVKLTPVDEGRARSLQSQERVRTAEDRVKEASKGRLAYVHLSGMDPSNLQRFQRAIGRFQADSSVKGLVLDVRENGGGNIHTQLMDVLLARPYIELQPRGSPVRIKQPNLFWDKPTVVLVNERSFSDAEVFPWCFQQAKRGKVVGSPTPGGVIGTNDIQLADGSTFRIPRVGWYGIDGTRLEGRGVQPDVLVWDTTEDRLAGRDPQLAKGIEVVLAEVDAKTPAAAPAAKPPAPTAPRPDEKPPEAAAPGAKPVVAAGASDPLADARAGEWVRFRVPGAPGGESEGAGAETLIHVRVRAVADGKVVFEKKVESGGGFVPPIPDEVVQVPILDALTKYGAVGKSALGQADVRGESVETLVADVDMGGVPARLTFTNAVPALGLLRIEWNQRTVLEAVDWGYDEPKPAPPAPASAAPDTPPEAAPSPRDGVEGAPDPLFDAQVGEWIRYKNRVQGEETVVLQEVIEVTDTEVVLKTSTRHASGVIAGDPVRRPRARTLSSRRGGEATVERATLSVGGKDLSCVALVTRRRSGGVQKAWFSAEVAATGLVRRERDGDVVSEVVDWGAPGTAPSAP